MLTPGTLQPLLPLSNSAVKKQGKMAKYLRDTLCYNHAHYFDHICLQAALLMVDAKSEQAGR